MPSWSEYKAIAQKRGSLAFELYVVESRLALGPEEMQEQLPAHLDYQKEMEDARKLFMAGPLSDATGDQMSGGGMIIYRADSMEEARSICDGDPMHKSGARTYSIKKWLVNEGSLSLNLSLSKQEMMLV